MLGDWTDQLALGARDIDANAVALRFTLAVDERRATVACENSGGLLGAPARDRSLASDLTSPSGTQFFCPRSSAFQSSELSKRHRMWIFSSLRHALERARVLPRKKHQ